MNERIEFYTVEDVKDENGDSTQVETTLFLCWAEVAKATTKEFRDRTINHIEGLEKRKERRVFYIRFRTDIDTSYFVKWRDKRYQINEIEEDWQSKDMLMVSVEVVE
jgi:SPP1 family predicted phage head-tail adaptor